MGAELGMREEGMRELRKLEVGDVDVDRGYTYEGAYKGGEERGGEGIGEITGNEGAEELRNCLPVE